MPEKHGFIDCDGRVLREMDEAELHAVSTIGGQIAKQHSCLIAKNGGKPKPLGSGTLVRAGRGVFVATAAHLFTNVDPDELIALYWGEDDQRAGAYKREIVCHEDLDLAVIPMPNNTPISGVTLDRLDLASPCTAEELFVVIGIPKKGFQADEETMTVSVEHWSLGLVGLPKASWPSKIDGAPLTDAYMLLNYTKRYATDHAGEPMCPIPPFGFSGGGIWTVPKSAGLVRSLTEAKLVAVQSAVANDKWKCLIATRIRHWLLLLGSAFPTTRTPIQSAHPGIVE